MRQTWVALFSVVSMSAHAAEFTGPAVARGVNESFDVVGTRLQLLQAQDLYDSTLVFASTNVRTSPGTFVLEDGTKLDGNLSRVQVNMGAGFGRPKDFALFVSAVIDTVSETAPTPLDSRAYQGLIDIGGAFMGLQLTMGFEGTHSLNGLSGRREFVPESASTGDYRAGAPYDLVYGKQRGAEEEQFGRTVYSAYHSVGAFVAASFADVSGYDEDGVYRKKENQLVDLRLQLQPLMQLLPSWAGLPMLALARLPAFKRLDAKLDALGENDLGSDGSVPYDVELGGDDIGGRGIRLRIVTQVRPNVAFRSVELGKVAVAPWYAYGGRVMLTNLGDAVEPSIDLYGLIFVRPVDPSDNALLGMPVHFGLSYSYNSPDTGTFLPIRHAHVFGVQAVFGPPEAARPIVPIVRGYDAIAERHDRSSDGSSESEEDE